MGRRFVDLRTIATRMQFKDDRINAALAKIAAKEQEMSERLALATLPSTAPAVTAEHLALIKATIAKDATPAELELFLYDCARQGVHPLDKLVHFTKRAGKYTPITSIDFMRIRASESGECAGIDDPHFEGTPRKPDFEATVSVYRLIQGQRYPFTATARWSEYKPDQAFMWDKMPHTMLGKCAEALALRKGFPKQLSGLYVKEEMDQARPSVPGRGKPSRSGSAGELDPSRACASVTPEPAAAADRNQAIPDAWRPFTTDPDKIRGHIVSGKRNKTKTTAVLDTGEEVVTLDPDLGAEVIAAKAAGSEVEITTRQTGVGTEIVSIVRLEDVVL